MTRRPALRTGLVAVLSTLAAFLVIGVYLGVLAYRYDQRLHRATALATGTVIKDDIGDEGDIRVRWAGNDGRMHEQQFGIYDTDRYTKGESFNVLYDLDHPSDRAYPADPEETSGADDLQVPIVLAGLGAIGFLIPWAVRVLVFRRRSTLKPVEVTAVGLRGENMNNGMLSAGDSNWVKLGDDTYQRVMGHPSLDAFIEGTVLVRGDLTGRRRVGIELPSGDQLVPIGRLRHSEPSTIDLRPTLMTLNEADELWVFPPGATVPPLRRWWRQPVAYGAVGAVVGTGMSLVFASVTAIPAFAAAVAAVLVNAWALTSN